MVPKDEPYIRYNIVQHEKRPLTWSILYISYIVGIYRYSAVVYYVVYSRRVLLYICYYSIGFSLCDTNILCTRNNTTR